MIHWDADKIHPSLKVSFASPSRHENLKVSRKSGQVLKLQAWAESTQCRLCRKQRRVTRLVSYVHKASLPEPCSTSLLWGCHQLKTFYFTDIVHPVGGGVLLFNSGTTIHFTLSLSQLLGLWNFTTWAILDILPNLTISLTIAGRLECWIDFWLPINQGYFSEVGPYLFTEFTHPKSCHQTDSFKTLYRFLLRRRLTPLCADLTHSRSGCHVSRILQY